MAITLSDERLAAREALVIEHMRSENVQEWDRTIKTFSNERVYMQPPTADQIAGRVTTDGRPGE